MKLTKIKFFGIMIFITILLDLIPSTGFITMGTISFTTMQIPTIVTAIVLGPFYGLLIGLVFGLISLFRALSRETALLDALFLNPLISVLPRLLIALASGWAYQLLKRLLDGNYKVFSVAMSALIGSLTNTVLVSISLYWVYPAELMGIFGVASREKLKAYLFNSLSFNAVTEAVICMIIGTALVLLFHKLMQKQPRRT